MPRQSLKQRPDGRYVCKYRGRFFYGKTQSEAFAAREEYKRLEEKGIRPGVHNVSFADYAAIWLPTYKGGCQNQTYNQYASYLSRAAAFFGQNAMIHISPSDIKRLYNQEMEGMGKWSIAKFTNLIRAVFASALNDGIIARNPCVVVPKPKGEAGTHRTIEGWERDAIQASVGRHVMAPAAVVMLYAGLRRGEALYLDIDRDIDFGSGTIFVRGAVRFDSNQPIEGATKSKAGMREIPLLAPAKRALNGMHGLLLPSQNGELMSLTVFRRRWTDYMRYLSDICGQRVAFTPHDLRHSYCTMLYDADVDMKSAIKWMGHADEKMIMRIYAHLSEIKQQEAINKVSTFAQKFIK